MKKAELLSLKGNTRGQRDELVNEILKVHTRFTARLGEYRFLLNMAEKFFNNLSQVTDKMIDLFFFTAQAQCVYAITSLSVSLSVFLYSCSTCLKSSSSSGNQQILALFHSHAFDQELIAYRYSFCLQYLYLFNRFYI